MNRELEVLGVQEEIEEVLKGLKPGHQAVLRLQYLEDLSQAEIGIALGRSTGAIKSLSSRAREEVLISILRARRNPDEKRNSLAV